MRRSLKDITIRVPTRGASLRFSRPDWNRKVPIRQVLILLAFSALLFLHIRVPHGSPNIPVPYALLFLDAICVLCIRHMGDLEYGTELIVFLAAAFAGIVIQRLTAGGYYKFSYAISSFTLLFAMVVCVILVTQKGYTELIWHLINGVSLVSAVCIIFQSVLQPFGLRLDKLGLLSNLFFNAWESTTAFRPAGPFLEPAMFAQIALLSLYHSLFRRRSWKRVLLLTLSLVCSTSALGLTGIAVLAMWFLFKLDSFYPISRSRKWTIITMCALAVAGILLFAQWLGIYTFERALSGSTLGVRFLRSLDLFWLMSPLEKLFGIGMQNQQSYLNYYGIILAHDTWETTIGGNREFAGLLGYILCTTGLTGFITFLFPFYRLFRRGSVLTQGAVLLFLYCCLFCGMFSQCTFVIYMIIPFAVFDEERRGITA